MILTVFRSRLNEVNRAEYDRHVQVTSALAEKVPGFIGHKMFVAEDGERLTLVEFESMASQRAWSLSPEHKAAAIAGRRSFYAEYKIQVCNVERQSQFTGAAPAAERSLPESAPAQSQSAEA